MIMSKKNSAKFGLIIGIMCLILTGCGGKSGDGEMSTSNYADMMSGFDVRRFDVTSDDLHDGVWDTIITNTEYGENVSPSLSWDPVEGAGSYVIYMVDPTARNWMHWKSNDVNDTDLEQGWASDDEYVGPYPPSGTHDYEIYVIAVKEGLDTIGGDFDAANIGFEDVLKALNVPAGNILAYGHIVGTYTHGDR